MNFPELPISVCVVNTSEGAKHLVTLVPLGAAVERGLIPEAIIGVLLHPLQPGQAITRDNFVRNSVFVEFLHGVIAAKGSSIPSLAAAARQQCTGWLYLVDGRTPTPEGDVPPHDIIGAFQVKGGEIVPASYQPNKYHRICSVRGFFRLESTLQEMLLAEIAACA